MKKQMLILNSGRGSRMGVLTSNQPKCMTQISMTDTILSHQLKLAVAACIDETIITTGYYDEVLVEYVRNLSLPLEVRFINNPEFGTTNYIYSMYLAMDYLVADNVIIAHGDLVYEDSVFEEVINSSVSCGVISSSVPLPEKDFKAKVQKGRIWEIGVDVQDEALAFQPLYMFKQKDWNLWGGAIREYVESGKTSCYAEDALNGVLCKLKLIPLDVLDRLCSEIDNVNDLEVVKKKLERIK